MEELRFDIDYRNEQESGLDYLNSIKDRIDERRSYKFIYQYLPFILITGVLICTALILNWKNFYLKIQPYSEPIAKKLALEQIDKVNDEKILLENVKESIKMSSKLNSNFLIAILICILAIFEKSIFFLLLLQNGQTNYFSTLGLDWLIHSFEETKSFPRQIKCQIVEYELLKANENSLDDKPTIFIFHENTICDLKLNALYESIFLIIWFWSVFLLVVLLNSLFQHIGFTISRCYRLERIRDLLPTVEESIQIKMAENRISFFVLESLSNQIKNRTKFRTIMKYLIDQKYYDEKSMINV